MQLALEGTRSGPGTWLWRHRHAVLSFLALFGLWELLAWLLALPPYLLPPPSKILADLTERWPRVLDGAWVTTSEIVLGYLLAVAVSVPLALLVAYSRTFEASVYPLIVFLQIVPKIAIAPLFIIWFGFGFLPKLLLVFLLQLLPDRGQQHRRLQVARPRRHGPRALDRGRRLAAVPQDPPAPGAARHLHRPQGRRGTGRDRRGGGRVRRLQQGPGLPPARIQRQSRDRHGVRGDHRPEPDRACHLLRRGVYGEDRDPMARLPAQRQERRAHGRKIERNRSKRPGRGKT